MAIRRFVLTKEEFNQHIGMSEADLFLPKEISPDRLEIGIYGMDLDYKHFGISFEGSSKFAYVAGMAKLIFTNVSSIEGRLHYYENPQGTQFKYAENGEPVITEYSERYAEKDNTWHVIGVVFREPVFAGGELDIYADAEVEFEFDDEHIIDAMKYTLDPHRYSYPKSDS